MKSAIQAVVFDADGTLFNSFELINEAYNHVAEVHGLQPPTAEEVRARLRLAMSLADNFRAFYPDHDIPALLNTNNTFMAQNILRVAAYDGLHELLGSLQADGFKLAVFTGGTRTVASLLASHGIDQHFTSIVHSERLANNKPHPEGFLLAVEECGVKPEHAIMIGDSMNDILAGKSAGALATIGITHGHGSREDLDGAGADYIVDSLTEILPVIEQLKRGA